MRTSTLKVGNITICAPNEKLIPDIGNMTFVAPFPFARKPVHVVPALEDFRRLEAVFQNEIDDGLQLGKIPFALASLFS